MTQIALPKEVVAAYLLDAAIDDLKHCNDLSDRVNTLLWPENSKGDYVSNEDMIRVCEWLGYLLEQWKIAT